MFFKTFRVCQSQLFKTQLISFRFVCVPTFFKCKFNNFFKHRIKMRVEDCMRLDVFKICMRRSVQLFMRLCEKMTTFCAFVREMSVKMRMNA